MIRRQWLNALSITGAVTVLATQPVVATVTPQQAVSLNVFTSQSDRPEIVGSINTHSQIVAASCLSEPIDASPRSVTVITRKQIEQQATLTRNLSEILNQLVPGLSPLTPSGRGELSLRGRRVGILIDGVPLGTDSVGLLSIDPDTIEQIEVIRAPSPLCRV